MHNGDPLMAVRGSDTSEAAAESAAGKARGRRAKLLGVMREAGPHGLTDAEAGERLGLPGDSLRPIRVALVAEGLVEDSGQRRPTGRVKPATGKRGLMTVWRSCQREDDGQGRMF